MQGQQVCGNAFCGVDGDISEGPLEGGQRRVQGSPATVIAYLGARRVAVLVGALGLTTKHLHGQAEVRSVAEWRGSGVLALNESGSVAYKWVIRWFGLYNTRRLLTRDNTLILNTAYSDDDVSINRETSISTTHRANRVHRLALLRDNPLQWLEGRANVRVYDRCKKLLLSGLIWCKIPE